MKTKINTLATMITIQGQQRLKLDGLGCQGNLDGAIANVKEGKKYTKIDVGHSGRYMIENSTGIIYGVKGYGIINRVRNYGTVDTIQDWDWSGYYATKI
jgi:hypothetical protein